MGGWGQILVGPVLAAALSVNSYELCLIDIEGLVLSGSSKVSRSDTLSVFSPAIFPEHWGEGCFCWVHCLPFSVLFQGLSVSLCVMSAVSLCLIKYYFYFCAQVCMCVCLYFLYDGKQSYLQMPMTRFKWSRSYRHM